tara:strand:- start:109765 stop:110043 length:279 start_codon:yes stop_codon:yes gene_type:complete
MLSIWLFAIFAPSVITLVERDGQTVVMTNLTEEENHDQGKKDFGEKKMVFYKYGIPSFSLLLPNQRAFKLRKISISNYSLEIPLPPPELGYC